MTTQSAAVRPAARSAADWPVQVLRPYPGCPGLALGRCAARSPRFGANPAAEGDRVVIGSAAGGSADSVVPRARGELVERAANVLAGRAAERDATRVADFTALRRWGVPALDPAGFAGADPRLRTVPMLWVPGRSLLTGAEVLVPAGAVYLAHRPPPGCAAPLRAGSTGLGAHPDPDAAARHAVLEVLERDLVTRAWYDERPPAAVPVADPPPEVREVLATLGLRADTWAVATPGGPAAVLAAVHTGDGREVTVGARCAPPVAGRVPQDAVAAAVYEALMVRWSMSTPAAARARAALAGGSPAGPLEHAVHAHEHHYVLAHLDRRLSAPGAAPGPGTDPVTALAALTGNDVVAVATPDRGFAGPEVTVVRVVAPGARRPPDREPPGATAPPHPIG